ncbi:hypothetical protein [Pelagicoccus sp. SDUM812003]|uniref:hypothetical protein n=1 Tax=Pelagicoccus sp. SDUM812003 TaxID=3041267 RepID=UPI00280C9D54|nr:hypothetical protein [Pelagicoccus sp. SDUM812003]MDQ8204796.1 hypothetical protein [Pelagicoccus sp. SDUM812003]
MKIRIKSLAGLMALSAGILTSSVLAQSGDGSDPETGYALNRDRPLNPIMRPNDQLLARALANLDTLPEGLQQDVVALRDTLQAISDAWEADYRPDIGAGNQAWKAARDAFMSDYADEIETAKELRYSVVTELRADFRERFDGENLGEEGQALLEEYRELKQSLAEQWRAIRDELGEDATREEIASAKEQFEEENAELIAQRKELASSLRELIRDNRRDRVELERGPMSDAMRELRNDIHALRQQVRARKQEAREEMKGMTREEREEYRRALIDELKDVHDDIKERRRQAIQDLRDDQDGDRRPEG